MGGIVSLLFSAVRRLDGGMLVVPVRFGAVVVED